MSPRGRLEAAFARRDDDTALVHLAWQPPLQALRTLRRDDRNGPTELIVTTLGPGLMGGDDCHVRVEAGADTHTAISSQSANRVLTARDGRPTSMQVDLAVGERALLEWLPLPTILQAGAVYRQHTRVCFAAGATALVLDVLVPGRLAMGEVCAFADLDTRLTVLDSQGEVLVAERQRVRPGEDDPRRLGMTPEPHFVFGSLFVLAPGALLDVLVKDLAAVVTAAASGSTAGLTLLPNDAGVLVRTLAPTADRATAPLVAAADCARVSLVRRSAVPSAQSTCQDCVRRIRFDHATTRRTLSSSRPDTAAEHS